MAKLIYSMITSLDGYAVDAEGSFGWNVPADEEVHGFVNDLFASVGTYLYGRRMYETMVYWETAHTEPGHPDVILDYARQWQAADKIVYSTTLESVSSARTTLRRDFDPEHVHALKADSDGDLTVDGPTLAAHASRAGLVDDFHLIVAPVLVGGGTRFFPDDVRVDLDLVDERRFDNGVLYTHYAAR